ncbi:hypothetical protein GQ54DRAFT_307518 [Martensiomyces pterosporus]|nr:hypothetical protein GQ54DRAFT_307518 [Martensiomyces pterosporus]
MFEYPPAHTSTNAHTGRYPTDDASRQHAVRMLARKKKYNISIWFQSALAAVYTVELVYYSVRLKRLAGVQPAIWRAGLLLLLLVVDLSVIWLTVRSKNSALSRISPLPSPSVAADRAGGQQPIDDDDNNGVPMDRVRPERSLQVPGQPFSYHMQLNANSPRAPAPATLDQQHPHGQDSHERSHERSHLNTPISG